MPGAFLCFCVEIVVNGLGQLFAHAGGVFQLVGGGFLHCTHALELGQQGFGCFGAYARHLGQGGGVAFLLHLLLAVGVGEPVGLVLDGGDEGKSAAVHVDGDLPALAVHHGPGAVVVILYHAVQRHIGKGGAC